MLFPPDGLPPQSEVFIECVGVGGEGRRAICVGHFLLGDLGAFTSSGSPPFYSVQRPLPAPTMSLMALEARSRLGWGPQFEAAHTAETLEAIVSGVSEPLRENVQVGLTLCAISFLANVLREAQRAGISDGLEWRLLAWSLKDLPVIAPRDKTQS